MSLSYITVGWVSIKDNGSVIVRGPGAGRDDAAILAMARSVYFGAFSARQSAFFMATGIPATIKRTSSTRVASIRLARPSRSR
jgi:hypothetical protein